MIAASLPPFLLTESRLPPNVDVMSQEARRWANKVALTISCAALAGCGARGVGLSDSDYEGWTGTSGASGTTTSAAGPTPLALYVNTHQGCAEPRPVSGALEAITPAGAGEQVEVVELFFQDECTNAGGQYILARSVEGYAESWLGGHACYFLPSPLQMTEAFGVLRYGITAALFELPSALCLGFPAEPWGVQSSLTAEAIAVLSTLEEAKALAAEAEAGAP